MSAVIPSEIVKFLEGATVGIGATRDDGLVPELHRIQGWTVGEDGRSITCVFPKRHSHALIPSLENNREFSMLTLGSISGPRASQPPNPSVDFHECYQLKGLFVGARPAKDEDLPLVQATRDRFMALFQPMFGFSDAACAARFANPGLAITFEVLEIYDQTPGPGAGSKIFGERA